MKVLVDTSVWSQMLRRKSPPPTDKAVLLQELIAADQRVYVIGIVIQEILQYVREPAQFNKIRKYLPPFPLLEPGYETYVSAAQLASHCRKHGVQVGTVDALIAATAIENECHLLTSDTDFEHIAKLTALELL